jgi:hypothetical protein
MQPLTTLERLSLVAERFWKPLQWFLIASIAFFAIFVLGARDTALRSQILASEKQLDSLSREIKALSVSVEQARRELAAIEQKTGLIDVDSNRLRLSVGSAHYDFPTNGNLNVGLASGEVCFAANDRTRPNDRDRSRCFADTFAPR